MSPFSFMQYIFNLSYFLWGIYKVFQKVALERTLMKKKSLISFLISNIFQSTKRTSLPETELHVCFFIRIITILLIPSGSDVYNIHPICIYFQSSMNICLIIIIARWCFSKARVYKYLLTSPYLIFSTGHQF